MEINKNVHIGLTKDRIKEYTHDLVKIRTPHIFKNKCSEGRALIIGTGPSSKRLMGKGHKLKDKFDSIIGINFAILDFEDILDYHIVLENKPTKVAYYLNVNEKFCRKDLPRIVNSKAVRFFMPGYNMVKADRINYGSVPDLRNYSNNDGKGFFAGYKNIMVDSSVLLQAVHFAGILGCSEVYTIGTELCFKTTKYYYGGEFNRKYRITHKPVVRAAAPQNKIIEIEHNGSKYYSTVVYKASASNVSKFSKDVCAPAGLNVFDFTEGIMEIPKAKLEDFIYGL